MSKYNSTNKKTHQIVDEKFFPMVDETIRHILKNDEWDVFKTLRQNYEKDDIIETIRRSILKMTDEIVYSFNNCDCETSFDLYHLDILNRNNMSKEVHYCLNFWYVYRDDYFDPSMGTLYEIIMDYNDLRNLYNKVFNNDCC